MARQHSYYGVGAEAWEYPEFIGKGTPACASPDVDPDFFFVDPHEAGHKQKTEIAKKSCKPCPYAIECLAWALKNNEIGVWGGTTERERKALKRNRHLGPPNQ